MAATAMTMAATVVQWIAIVSAVCRGPDFALAPADATGRRGRSGSRGRSASSEISRFKKSSRLFNIWSLLDISAGAWRAQPLDSEAITERDSYYMHGVVGSPLE